MLNLLLQLSYFTAVVQLLFPLILQSVPLILQYAFICLVIRAGGIRSQLIQIISALLYMPFFNVLLRNKYGPLLCMYVYISLFKKEVMVITFQILNH